MQRSSTKIGALASALAKAQSELANPEKSLVATLPPCDPWWLGEDLPLCIIASGLELVRKCWASMRLRPSRRQALTATAA
jgi:hypothetical protein